MKRVDYLLQAGIIILFTMCLSISCSKDDDDDPVAEFNEMSFNSEEILNTLPEGLTSSNDEMAENTVSWIESATDMSSFIDNMTPPENAQKVAALKSTVEESWSWSWSYGGESFSFYWTYDEDATKEYWEMDIQYNNGTVYDYIDAWELKDGTQGEIEYNFNWICALDEESSTDCYDLYWKYTW